MIDGLQTIDSQNVVLPANWVSGEPMVNRPPKTFADLQTRLEEIKQCGNGMSWYLSFKDDCTKDIETNMRKIR